jgi:chromosome segregation ATPase
MKRTQIILALFSATVFTVATGCKPESEKTAGGEANPDAAAQLDKAKEEMRQAIDTANDYAFAQRTEYAEKIRAELADLNRELDKLSAKVESANESVKADAKAKVQEIRGKVAVLDERLDALKGATESTWDDVKTGVKKAYDDVKDSFKQVRQWLSEKIAPGGA